MGANELLRLELGYSANANNGNIASQRMTFPAIDSAAALDVTQTYQYDPLNRIKRIEEGSQSRDFDYDAFGNMWVPTTSTGFARDSFTPATSAWFDANNRLTNPALGVQHDAAGNLTAMGGFEYTYDAEGMMTEATPSVGSSTVYRYDGEGRRVQKQTGTGAVTTFVYSAFGELAAEYSSGGIPVGQPTGTHYLMADHLGSTRLVTDATGAVISRHDYLPFQMRGQAWVFQFSTPLILNEIRPLLRRLRHQSVRASLRGSSRGDAIPLVRIPPHRPTRSRPTADSRKSPQTQSPQPLPAHPSPKRP